METSEFQIGDFVKVKPSGMIIKVAAVHQKKIGYHAIQTRLEWVRYDLLEPIPISPDILEKNFEKKIFYGIFDDYFDFEIREINDRIFIAQYHSCEMNLPDEQVTIFFVHQLQQFMRHCGIKNTLMV